MRKMGDRDDPVTKTDKNAIRLQISLQGLSLETTALGEISHPLVVTGA